MDAGSLGCSSSVDACGSAAHACLTDVGSLRDRGACHPD